MDPKWEHIDGVYQVLQEMNHATWTRDFGLKYLTIRVDTRDNCCVIFDRNEKRIMLDELKERIRKSNEYRTKDIT
jgi:hypothetical protein